MKTREELNDLSKAYIERVYAGVPERKCESTARFAWVDGYIAAQSATQSRPEPSVGWIDVNERLPELPKNRDYSDNVLAWENGKLKVMCYAFVKDDDNNWGKVWCKVYDGLDGDGEFDDNYEPTHWMPLPSPPATLTKLPDDMKGEGVDKNGWSTDKWDDIDMCGFAGYYSGRTISAPTMSVVEIFDEYRNDLIATRKRIADKKAAE